MTPDPAIPSPRITGLLCALFALVVMLCDAVIAPGAAPLREGGGVEMASALLYAVPLALVVRGGGGRQGTWMTPVLLAAMAMRELDFDKRFTSEGLLSIKILTRDTALAEKLLGLLVWAVLVTALVLILRRRGPALWRGIADRAPWALYVAGGLVLAAVSKSLDGLGRKLDPVMDVPGAVNALAGRVEEALELGIPIHFAMAAAAALAARRQSPAP